MGTLQEVKIHLVAEDLPLGSCFLLGEQNGGTEGGSRTNQVFRTLWGTARHWHESDDIEMARALIHRLRTASMLAHEASPLPSIVEAFIASPPLRLSLHPRAMLATCAVHASEMPARWEECCRHPALPFCH